MDYSRLLHVLRENGMAAWARRLEARLRDYFSPVRHGDYPAWRRAVSALPAVRPGHYCPRRDAVTIGAAADCSAGQRALIKA